MAQHPMRVRAYCAHPSIRDHWPLRCMSRCPDQVISLKRDPSVKSPSKLSTHLSTHCNRDVLLKLWERLSLEIRVRALFIPHLITPKSWSWTICLVQYNFSDWSRGRRSVTPPQNLWVY
ncbi:uncharacterized protein TNCV_5118341 [Trichonephila clavipes]|nr:uncharacterized protein TNCV_5118341 [Trichonephila clavipes]